MFFDDLREVAKIASRVNTSVFVIPNSENVRIPGSITLKPEERTTITIEQVREVLSKIELRQVKDQFVLIRPADKLGPAAANALLKSLEEPGEKVHFVLIVDSASKLLPTLLSRAAVYYWRGGAFRLEVMGDDDKKLLAKRLLAAKPSEIIEIAEGLTKKKDGARGYVLDVLRLSIEMLYKSYFMTGKDVFVRKLPKFLEAYENILRNGHIKLHLVADLS